MLCARLHDPGGNPVKPLYAAIAATLLCTPFAALAADPPPETRALLTDATKPLGEREFSGVYTFRSHRATSKTNGDDLEERLEIFEIRQSGADSTERTLVSSTLNDEDVTEERRAEIAEQEAGGGGRGGGLDMKLPTAEHDIYVFKPAEPEGELCVSHYEPDPDSRDVDGATEGRLAWNCATGDPAWLEASLVDNPMMVDDLQARWTFQRAGELIVIRTNVFEVVAGLPFRKRKMAFNLELVDLQQGEVDVAGGGSAEDSQEGAGHSE